jgi:hypothetical protein
VSQALRSLSPAHREVLNETYFCNRSVNEAARLLGLPVDTVKSRVYEALHALRMNMRQIEQFGQTTSAPAQASTTKRGGQHRAMASAPWPVIPGHSYATERWN